MRRNSLAAALIALIGLAIRFHDRASADEPSPATASAPAETPLPLELQPYRVYIAVSFESRPDFGRSFRELVLRHLGESLDRAAGAMLNSEIVHEQRAGRTGVARLQRITAQDLGSETAPAGTDKVFLLSVESAGGGYRIAGREWDVATAQLGPLESRFFPQRRAIADEAADLVRSLFRGVAFIEPSRNGPVVIRGKGAALLPHDDAWQTFRDGALYETYYRYLNKERVVERIQQVPWTYLTVESASAGVGTAQVTSGLRAPISGRRRRIEIVALGVVRPIDATRLMLVTRPPARRPLGGVELEVVSAPPEAEAADSDSPKPARTLRFVTDRNGQVTLARSVSDGDRPVWLYARSGKNLLARVPFVPGIHASEVLELPDDTLRLDVEGRIAQFQSELIDTVARRAVLVALARNRAKERDWPGVDEYVKQLAEVPTATTIASNLSAIRLNGVKAARAKKDKATEFRINKLCDETGELIKNYLGEDKLSELREELAELRQIADQDAAAEKQFNEQSPPNDGKAPGKPAPGTSENATPPTAKPPAAAPAPTTATGTVPPQPKAPPTPKPAF